MANGSAFSHAISEGFNGRLWTNPALLLALIGLPSPPNTRTGEGVNTSGPLIEPVVDRIPSAYIETDDPPVNAALKVF